MIKKTKKTKVKKPKTHFLTPVSFSKRYESLFNSTKLSDSTVIIENETLNTHKFILRTASDVFQQHFESSDSYTFDTSINSKAAKAVIQFLYTGSVDYSDASLLVTFMLLCNKLKIKNLNELKVPAKVYLNGVLEYIEKDLSNRMSELDSLVESVDFKKMEKEDLTKLYAKKKWLQKSPTFLNQIILKDLSDDESGSEKDSDEEEEEEEEEEDGGSDTKWDKKLHGTNYQIDKKKKLLTHLHQHGKELH